MMDIPATSPSDFGCHPEAFADQVIIERQREEYMEPSAPNNYSNGLALLGVISLEENCRTSTAIIFLHNNVEINETASLSARDIKDLLGLNLSQLALILSASRPQVYKWVNGETEPQRESVRNKIQLISQAMGEIDDSHHKFFGKMAKRFITPSETLIDVLSKEDLTLEEILEAYNKLKPTIESQVARAQTNKADLNRNNGPLESDLPL